MKCYKCGQEASTAVKATAMFSGKETTKFYCKDCYDKKLWKHD
jgi:protein-arginine kinase activator protein McsA